RINDHLTSAIVTTHARLLSSQDVPFHALRGYAGAITRLNSLEPKRGFIWREYSPASVTHAGVQRMYFTEENAARIDSIRAAIGAWVCDGYVTALEERLLLADLVMASNRIANTAGTYGCFLSQWTNQAKERLLLRERVLFPQQVQVETTEADVTTVMSRSHDVV